MIQDVRLTFETQVAMLHEYLGARLPDEVLALFRPGTRTASRLLPLATGREFAVARPGSPAQLFYDACERMSSVLGHAIMNADPSGVEDYVWPSGLLTVEDCGCAIWRSIDLASERLRVIEYECLDAVDDPTAAIAPYQRLAYSEPLVPRRYQHRFVVVADTLQEWARTL